MNLPRVLVSLAAGRPRADELRILARSAKPLLGWSFIRDLGARPFADWDDALEMLVWSAQDEPMLVTSSPELPGVIALIWIGPARLS